jgi:hypothetical protein
VCVAVGVCFLCCMCGYILARTDSAHGISHVLYSSLSRSSALPDSRAFVSCMQCAESGLSLSLSLFPVLLFVGVCSAVVMAWRAQLSSQLPASVLCAAPRACRHTHMSHARLAQGAGAMRPALHNRRALPDNSGAGECLFSLEEALLLWRPQAPFRALGAWSIIFSLFADRAHDRFHLRTEASSRPK